MRRDQVRAVVKTSSREAGQAGEPARPGEAVKSVLRCGCPHGPVTGGF